MINSAQLWDIYETQLKTIGVVLRALNSKQPLLRLPTEILNQIMEHIPHSRALTFRPVWQSCAANSLDLIIPISRTCHRLREVALTNPFLWRHLYSALPDNTNRLLMERSRDIPLTIVMDDDHLLKVLVQDIRERTQELHCTYMDDRIGKLLPYLKFGWPALEFFSFTQSGFEHDNGDVCPLSAETTPRLRYLHMQHITTLMSAGLPNLTHISLSRLNITRCHVKVAKVLTSCPNLVNIILDRLGNWTPPRNQQPQATLSRLRRVTLHEMTTQVNRFYLLVFGCERDGIAVQVLSREVLLQRFPVQDILPRYIRGGPSLLAIIAHWHPSSIRLPPHIADRHLLSVTAVGPHSTFRISRQPKVLGEHLHRILTNKESLRHLREVWLVDISSSNPPRMAENVAAALASLTTLETVVVVYDHVCSREPRMNMRMLPKLSDPNFASAKLKTLCLVHGHGSAPRPHDGGKICLSKMLQQLAFRQYEYFETLILRTTPHLTVDEEDLEELHRYFPVVRYEHISRLPDLPLPEYCIEPATPHPTFEASMW